jgi:hypothetical protein
MLFAGLAQAIVSVLTVILKVLFVVWFCASFTSTTKEYVVDPVSAGAVPVKVPEDDKVTPSGSAPDTILYVKGVSPVADTDVDTAFNSYTLSNEPAAVVYVGVPEY